MIGAGRYERKAGRRNRRNGTYPRDLVTSVGLIEELAVPCTRKGHQTQVFARYHRRQDELDQAIGAMFVAGASQRQVDLWVTDGNQAMLFLTYPLEMRRSIYTTNALESVHMRLRKTTKNRGHFPNDDAGRYLAPSSSTWSCATSARRGQCRLENGSCP